MEYIGGDYININKHRRVNTYGNIHKLRRMVLQ